MDILIRQLKDGPDGVAEYNDTELAADSLTIGSGAESSLQLLGESVAAEHAIIRSVGGNLPCRPARAAQ
jgi:hypothetical protein